MRTYSLLFRERYRNATGPNRVPNVVCFSLIFLLSLTGAVGLAIRAGSGSAFCEEFLSSDPEKCREASWAIALSWGSVIVGKLLIAFMWCDILIGSCSYHRYTGFMF